MLSLAKHGAGCFNGLLTSPPEPRAMNRNLTKSRLLPRSDLRYQLVPGYADGSLGFQTVEPTVKLIALFRRQWQSLRISADLLP